MQPFPRSLFLQSTIYISLLLFLRKETRYYQLACHWTVITQLSAAGHIWDTFLWPLYPGTVTKSELVSMNWEAAVDISPDCEIIRNVATSDTLAALYSCTLTTADQWARDHWPLGSHWPVVPSGQGTLRPVWECWRHGGGHTSTGHLDIYSLKKYPIELESLNLEFSNFTWSWCGCVSGTYFPIYKIFLYSIRAPVYQMSVTGWSWTVTLLCCVPLLARPQGGDFVSLWNSKHHTSTSPGL